MTYDTLLARLNRSSVRKHFDAYEDVPWEDPAYAIEVSDPRWELGIDDPLGATVWYRQQTQPIRAQIGLHLIAAQMKIGVDFENGLSRGLLEFAATRPNGSAEFRYALHEVIEEGQHSLMFQEFINRTGLDVRGLGRFDQWATRRVVSFGRKFPELFFLFVLGGEAPIDYVQRKALAQGGLHPLLERVTRIHVTEEARHICFASHFLRERVPELSPWRMTWLRLRTPIIFKVMTEQMLRPPQNVVDIYGIPDGVVREAYQSRAHRQNTLDGLAPVRSLCAEIGVVTPALVPFWRALGIWSDGTEVCRLPAASL